MHPVESYDVEIYETESFILAAMKLPQRGKDVLFQLLARNPSLGEVVEIRPTNTIRFYHCSLLSTKVLFAQYFEDKCLVKLVMLDLVHDQPVPPGNSLYPTAKRGAIFTATVFFTVMMEKVIEFLMKDNRKVEASRAVVGDSACGTPTCPDVAQAARIATTVASIPLCALTEVPSVSTVTCAPSCLVFADSRHIMSEQHLDAFMRLPAGCTFLVTSACPDLAEPRSGTTTTAAGVPLNALSDFPAGSTPLDAPCSGFEELPRDPVTAKRLNEFAEFPAGSPMPRTPTYLTLAQARRVANGTQLGVSVWLSADCTSPIAPRCLDLAEPQSSATTEVCVKLNAFSDLPANLTPLDSLFVDVCEPQRAPEAMTRLGNVPELSAGSIVLSTPTCQKLAEAQGVARGSQRGGAFMRLSAGRTSPIAPGCSDLAGPRYIATTKAGAQLNVFSDLAANFMTLGSQARLKYADRRLVGMRGSSLAIFAELPVGPMRLAAPTCIVFTDSPCAPTRILAAHANGFMSRSIDSWSLHGAQLVKLIYGKEEVVGSIPIVGTWRMLSPSAYA